MDTKHYLYTLLRTSLLSLSIGCLIQGNYRCKYELEDASARLFESKTYTMDSPAVDWFLKGSLQVVAHWHSPAHQQ